MDLYVFFCTEACPILASMPRNEYRFVTKWHLPGTCEQIYRLLNDLPTLRTYWPSLYREVSLELAMA